MSLHAKDLSQGEWRFLETYVEKQNHLLKILKEKGPGAYVEEAQLTLQPGDKKTFYRDLMRLQQSSASIRYSLDHLRQAIVLHLGDEQVLLRADHLLHSFMQNKKNRFNFSQESSYTEIRGITVTVLQ